MSKRTVYILSLIVINIALDQISKVIARATLMPYEEVKVLGSVFTLNNVENDGAFLGLGGDFHPFIKIALLWLLPILVLGFVLRMILTDKREARDQLKRMSYDGREPDIPWRDQNIKSVGYHYYMTPETAQRGLEKLSDAIKTKPRQWVIEDWPDLKKIDIFK